MLRATSDPNPDDMSTVQYDLDDVDPARAPVQGRRRSRRSSVALVTTAVVASLAAGWAYTASPSHPPVDPTPVGGGASASPSLTPSAFTCDLGTGGISEISAAVETCLVHTGARSLIAAIVLPGS